MSGCICVHPERHPDKNCPIHWFRATRWYRRGLRGGVK